VKTLFTLGDVVATPGALAAIGYRATTFLPTLPAISPVIGVISTLMTGRRINYHLRRDSG
jgi:hypothetical protein